MAVDEFGNFRGRQSQVRGPNVGGLIGSVRQQGQALDAAGQALQQAGAIWAKIEAKAQAEKAQRLMKEADLAAIEARQQYTEAISQPDMAATPEKWPDLARDMIGEKIAALDDMDAPAAAKEDLRYFWRKQQILLTGSAREGAVKRQIEMNQAASLSLGQAKMQQGDFEGAAAAMADLSEPMRAKALAEGRFTALDNTVVNTASIAELGTLREQVNARDGGGNFTHFPELDASKRTTLIRRLNERENQVRAAQGRNSAAVIRDVRQGVVFDEGELRQRAAANNADSIAPEDVDYIIRLQEEVDAKRQERGSSGIGSDPIAKLIKDELVETLLGDSNPDRTAFKQVFDRIERAAITPEQKADLYELALRAREQDVRDGTIHRPWRFNRDLSETEQVFLTDYYQAMQNRLRMHPNAAGFGDLFTEQEQKILDFFKKNPKATEAQQQAFADGLKREATIRISDAIRPNIWGAR